ncbi:ComF family protein [Candidatus Omnitrophota bacterium]
MLKKYFGRLLNIIYPETCPVCSRPSKNSHIQSLLCPDCLQAIKKNTPPLCALCGRQIRGEQIAKRACPECLTDRGLCFDRSLSPCIYEGVTRELIHKFKYQNRDYLNSFLSSLLIDCIRQNRIGLDNFNLVIPIPLHKTRLREREFNQAELIARSVAREFSIALSPGNLWRKHNRRAQVELNDVERRNNVKGCFALRNPEEIKHKNILLIDDVLTTGATCSEAASVLKTAGAGSIFVLTLAN